METKKVPTHSRICISQILAQDSKDSESKGDSPAFESQDSPLSTPSNDSPNSPSQKRPYQDSDDINFTEDSPAKGPKQKRRRFNEEETQILMSHFHKNPKPSARVRTHISTIISGMSPRSVQIWFQNRRAKLKSERKYSASDSQDEPTAPTQSSNTNTNSTTTSPDSPTSSSPPSPSSSAASSPSPSQNSKSQQPIDLSSIPNLSLNGHSTFSPFTLNNPINLPPFSNSLRSPFHPLPIKPMDSSLKDYQLNEYYRALHLEQLRQLKYEQYREQLRTSFEQDQQQRNEEQKRIEEQRRKEQLSSGSLPPKISWNHIPNSNISRFSLANLLNPYSHHSPSHTNPTPQ